jgi:hypothetical protein
MADFRDNYVKGSIIWTESTDKLSNIEGEDTQMEISVDGWEYEPLEKAELQKEIWEY